MRLDVAFAAVMSTAAAVSAFSWGVNSLEGKDSVPGENPLVFCDSASQRESDIVAIDNVDLLPNPPESGAKLVIRATGTVFEPIFPGAYVDIVVKYGLIKLLNTRLDLCEQTAKADLECPIEKGILTILQEVDIPKEVPPGQYNVHGEVLNADGKHITCLEASVHFGGRREAKVVEL